MRVGPRMYMYVIVCMYMIWRIGEAAAKNSQENREGPSYLGLVVGLLLHCI